MMEIVPLICQYIPPLTVQRIRHQIWLDYSTWVLVARKLLVILGIWRFFIANHPLSNFLLNEEWSNGETTTQIANQRKYIFASHRRIASYFLNWSFHIFYSQQFFLSAEIRSLYYCSVNDKCDGGYNGKTFNNGGGSIWKKFNDPIGLTKKNF